MGREEQSGVLQMLAAERPVSRRSFMGMVAGAAALAGGSGLLEACGVGGSNATVAASPGAPLPIGVSQALTGALANTFKALYAPLSVAVEEINASGGIMGRKINLDVQDDEGKPATEPTVARNLVGNGDPFIVGPVGSSQALAMAEGLRNQKVILAPFADLESLGDPKQYRFSFRITRTTSARVALGTDWALDKAPSKKVGILYENTAFGQDGGPQAQKRLESKNAKPVAVEAFDQLSTAVNANVARLKAAGAESVVMFSASADDNLRILNAMLALDYTPFLSVTLAATLDNIATRPDLGRFKDKVAIAQFFNLAWSPGKPLGARQQKYARAVAAKLGPNDPKTDVMAAPFYDFLYVLKHAIETAKSFDYDKVLAQLERTKDFDGLLCKITFTADSHSAVTPDNAHDVLVMATQTDPNAPESLGFMLKKV